MKLNDNIKVKNRLIEMNCTDENTIFISNHFSHNGIDVLYEDFSKIAEKEGFIVSYDGMQFAKSGNQASVSGMMDFFTYLGAGIGSLLFGYFIKGYGYRPVFITFFVLVIASLFMLKINKKRLEKV